MLNEVYTLERSLTRFNVPIADAHAWVKRLGKEDVLVAGVGASGIIETVEPLEKAVATTLFTVQQSNHARFPALKWPCPVLNVADYDGRGIDDLSARVEMLRAICTGASMSDGQTRAYKRLREFCGELRLRFGADAEPDFRAFPALLDRIVQSDASVALWTESLVSAALRAAHTASPALLEQLELLLVGAPDPHDNDDLKVPLLFDLSDCTEFPYRVAAPQMGAYFSRRLAETEVAGDKCGRCALSGQETSVEADKFPSPRLPVLGDTVLMSMNPDTPCQARYGRIGPDVFPVGKETAAALDAALKALTAPERRGKTWVPIPGTLKGKFNLLVVYLEADPLLEAEIASAFAASEEAEQLYTSICVDVCNALRARKAADSSLLRLFVLNKIDPGRVQVELSGTFTSDQVISGVSRWLTAAQNRPNSVSVETIVPSPAEVMRCLQLRWERGGTEAVSVPGCRLSDVYNLLVAGMEESTSSAHELLHLAVSRSGTLLTAIGHAAHKKSGKRPSRDALKNAAVAASLLSIVLDELGSKKESYMGQPAFLIGRFLSLADTLHAEYSKEVRKGDIPPQLLGNALIPTAIADPQKGFARMLQRIRVYQAWARKSGTALARWSCGEMGKIAAELEGKLPARLDEPDQAQLLLGYLARSEGKDNTTGEGEGK